MLFRILLAVFAVAIITVPFLAWWLAQSSLPKSDGVVIVSSLLKEASIVSDDRGVPYITASSELDLYRAQGYWSGAQRLFQMDMLRRLGRGELSEVFGSHCLAQDKLMRQIGFSRGANEELKLLSREAKTALDAYCQGVNEAIAQSANKKPPEFWVLGYYPKNWTPADTLVVMKYLQYMQEESWSLDDLRQRVYDKVGAKVASSLFEDNFPEPAAKTVGVKQPDLGSYREMPLLPPFVRKAVETVPGIGSNGWVVAGSGTDTGGCLLALDRHSQLVEPNLWYALTLSAPGYKVAGVTIPGVPGVMYGRNNNIAWGATAFKADTQDLFIEQFSPQFPNKYKTPEGWAVAREVMEEISTKGAFHNQLIQHKVLVTRHGPVLLSSEGGGNAVILAWSGNDIALPSYDTFYKLNRCTDWQGFRNTLRNYRGSPQTFLFADKTGNIGLQIAGNLPVRKESELTRKLKASLVLPGWAGSYDWTGRLEFDDMPSSLTKEGFLVANNVSLTGFDNPVTPYPVQRLRSILGGFKQSGRHPGLPEMADLQGDEYAPLYRLATDTLRASIEKKEGIDQFQLSAMQVLDQWDGYLRRQSSAATIYESFIRTMARRSLMHRLSSPQLANEYLRRWPRWSVQVEHLLSDKNQEWMPPEERKFDTFVMTSFGQALRDLRPKNATEQDLTAVSWDRFHKTQFRNIIFEGWTDLENSLSRVINLQPEGVGGDSDTVNAFNVDLTGAPGQFNCTIGPTERLLIDMSDAEKFYETQPLGQSGHFLSPNRSDQIRSWLQVKPLPVAFSDDQSGRQQRHKISLKPETGL